MHYAKKSFTYCGDVLEVGQLLELGGARNDAKLVAHNYLVEVPTDAATVSCAKCRKSFISESALGVHNAHC